MIKVLHAIDTTGPGGAETIFVNLVKGLNPMRFKSFVAITGPGWVCNELIKNGVEPIFVRSRGTFNLKYLFDLITTIRKNKIDLIQSHLFGSNLYCCLAGLICRVPVISTFHGFVDTSGRGRLMSIKRRIIDRGSKAIVFVSERLRTHFVRTYGFSGSKSITIYNGIDTSVFRPQKDDSIRKELGLGAENVLIGVIGNIRPAKGYDYYLNAARLVFAEHPKCRFVIAGEGAGKLFEDIRALRQSLGLKDVFFFLGYRADVAAILNNLDVFVLSSVSEGFSLSTIEAMACGVPVVVTQSGGPQEIVAHEKNGIVVKACDPLELANGISRLLGPSQWKEDIVASGIKTVSESFSLSKMISNYQDMYTNAFRCN